MSIVAWTSTISRYHLVGNISAADTAQSQGSDSSFTDEFRYLYAGTAGTSHSVLHGMTLPKSDRVRGSQEVVGRESRKTARRKKGVQQRADSRSVGGFELFLWFEILIAPDSCPGVKRLAPDLAKPNPPHRPCRGNL